jgi:hypothetical protein
MTTREIIRLARKAGIVGQNERGYIIDCGFSEIKLFALWIIKTEREECARVAEKTVCFVHQPTGIDIYGTKIAEAIRERGQA